MITKVCVAEIMIMPGGEALINREGRGFKTYYPIWGVLRTGQKVVVLF